MKEHVVFIALDEYNNLGIGYLSAVLRKSGYSTSIIDPDRSKSAIMMRLSEKPPLIIGFSVVSEGYIGKFAGLASYLRKRNILCHFTAGGHYCSLNPERVFREIPELDSLVRFDGEETMLELALCLTNGEDPGNIRGLALNTNGDVKLNEPRPLIRNLDALPFPVRTRLRKIAYNFPIASIIAGRGCLNHCTFCNTRIFYKEAGGPVKRIRKPELVVKEMLKLHKRRNCRVFVFMDDDFPIFPSLHKRWVSDFCTALGNAGLAGKVLWKICCRPDEVDGELFSLMRSYGLYGAFLGIEDGTAEGLARMKKNISPDRIKESISTLKNLSISIDYGFMLFQPHTTFSSLDRNLKFLMQLCNDGYMPVVFNKAMPDYKTELEKELKREGRLITESGPDYNFLEEALNDYYKFIMECFRVWLTYSEGYLNMARLVNENFVISQRMYGIDPFLNSNFNIYRGSVRESNTFILQTLQALADLFSSGKVTSDALDHYKNLVTTKHNHFLSQINDLYELLYYIALRQPATAIRS